MGDHVPVVPFQLAEGDDGHGEPSPGKEDPTANDKGRETTMAKREGKHLRDADSGKRTGKGAHRGRKVAVICVVLALLAAGLGYAGWRWYGSLLSADGSSQQAGQAEEQTQEQADASTDDASADDATSDAGDSADADSQQAEGSQESDSQDADEAQADDQSQTEEKRMPGQHGDFTADDLAAMASAKGQISVLGARDGFSDSQGYQELLYQVAVWQRSGYALGFVLTDLGSGATVSYNTDQVFYPASSIKAPFVCSLYQEVVENGGSESSLDPVASNCIINSDNDAFRSLHASYGESAFLTWLSDAGVPATAGHAFSYFSQYYYPQVSTSQLDLMWAQIYRYCTSGTTASQTLASYLSQRTTSPIADAVGSKYSSWGKAGWYYSSGDYGAEPATVDAGIVFADKGPYRLVMMSDAPGMLDAMADLAYGMDAAAADLTA